MNGGQERKKERELTSFDAPAIVSVWITGWQQAGTNGDQGAAEGASEHARAYETGSGAARASFCSRSARSRQMAPEPIVRGDEER